MELSLNRTKVLMNISTVVGLALCVAFVAYGISAGIFTSQDALGDFLFKFGYLAPVVFILIQAVQVVLPILPGSIGCLGGVLIFGPFLGFLYSYIGICIGSVAAFLLARRYGQPLVQGAVSPKKWDKYSAWMNRNYDRLFAVAIIFPLAPDDFLCYLSGLTNMSLKKFTIIILLCKPLSIALYSAGLYFIFDQAMGLVLS